MELSLKSHLQLWLNSRQGSISFTGFSEATLLSTVGVSKAEVTKSELVVNSIDPVRLLGRIVVISLNHLDLTKLQPLQVSISYIVTKKSTFKIQTSCYVTANAID